MCLKFNPEKSAAKVKKIRERGKPIFAYKVLLESHLDSPYISPYTSPYQGFQFRDGWNYSGRESTEITKLEMERGILDGFHCYLTLKEARASENVYRSSRTRFFRVKINPEDLVAFGHFDTFGSLVCTNLTIDLKKSKR